MTNKIVMEVEWSQLDETEHGIDRLSSDDIVAALCAHYKNMHFVIRPASGQLSWLYKGCLSRGLTRRSDDHKPEAAPNESKVKRLERLMRKCLE